MTSPSCRSTFPSRSAYICCIFILLSSINSAYGCFNSIISFGDSYADTGNLLHLSAASADIPPHYALPPYGETFFHHPTGRESDGRLVIDFIAQHFGLPFVPPYFGVNATKNHFGQGVNFAVSGATALDYTYLVERQIYNPTTNVSLRTQLGWFKEKLASGCHTSSTDCSKFLQSSLILMGEIGGNDICYAFFQGKAKEEVQSLFAPIINSISLAVNELIELGAVTIMVPGNIPIGCLTVFLAYFSGSDKKDYDPSTGCITWLNNFSERYNELLQIQLNHIRELYPHATIIYADYHNAAMQFYNSPDKYGFTRTLTACCGAGGPYNSNSSVKCGYPPSTSCDDPSSYVNWDGVHMTEAAYKLIAKGLLQGPYSVPHINGMCSSMNIDGHASS